MRNFDSSSEQLVQTTPWEISANIYIVAEIGINHNGDIEKAKELIDSAKDAGCDAVKFQKRTIDIVYTKEVLASPRDSPWGTTQRQQKEGLEFGKEEYDIIDNYCKDLKIDWFASAWDIPSQEFLRCYDSPFNKIASAMTTHPNFPEEVAKEKKTTFISTGMCTIDEIDRVIEIFKRHECPHVLMHTVSEYPSADEILNMRCMQTLKERYKCPVGYSGHETTVSPSVIAAIMGAVVIERHITLDRSMYGSDQSASLEAPGLKSLVSQIRRIPSILGTGNKKITEIEHTIANKLRYW
jgi:N-acetylneuraminate synthase